MAFDLTTINPSEWIEFRDCWIKESGLEGVGADRLFDDVSLAELVDFSASELKEYAKEIGLSVVERKRLKKGIKSLKYIDNKTSTTPTPKKRKKSRSIKKKKSKSKSKSKSRSNSRSNSCISSPLAPISLPTKETHQSIADKLKSGGFEIEEEENERPLKLRDLPTEIENAITNLESDGEATKDDIRATFHHFKTKITERELKLIRDVDSTIIKKRRLLETQRDYIKENGHETGINELAVDPNIGLLIEKPEILRCLLTAGWIEGASSDNVEEQEAYELEQKRRELTRQQFLTVEKLKQVTIFERDCAEKREDSIRLQTEVKADIRKIRERTEKCEKELNVAKPLLEEAEKLVSTINKKQLNEIRVLKKPPFVLELVMSAVVTMLGNDIKCWKDVQKCLSDTHFVQNIMEFNTNSLKKKTREKVKKYSNETDFNEERANKASRVAGPLVKWVKSQLKYSELLDIVRPMQREIKQLKKKLDKKQKLAKKCINTVQELELNISKCRTDIDQMVENMISLQEKYDFKDEYPVTAAVANELA
eukprot:150172_1